MAGLSRGDIWIVHPVDFPKPRPAIVMSINAVNDLCPDIIMVPITTKPGPLRVALSPAAADSGLEEQSFAKCEAVTVTHKSRLKRKIGAIRGDDLVPVEQGLRRVLGLH